MKTLDIMWTKGDRATQPGGLILRHNEAKDEYVTHRFNRAPHTRAPNEFFWGHYFKNDVHGVSAKDRALKDFAERKALLLPYEISEAELIAKGDVNLQPEFD